MAAFSQLSNANEYRLYHYINDRLPSKFVPEEWSDYDPIVGQWRSISEPTGCSNWSPSASMIASGLAFTQTATDCSTEQNRSVQHRIKNKKTGDIRDSGAPTTETRTVITQSTRQSVGMLEEWLAIAPLYSAWTNASQPYGCSAWSPSASTVAEPMTFDQSSSSCLINQQRTKTNQEQEKYTHVIRASGTPVTESQVLNNQSSTRSYTVKASDWADSGQYSNCTEWLPLASTQPTGVMFQQTQTCTATQIRTLNGFVGSAPDSEFKAITQTQAVPNQIRTQQVMDSREDKICKGDASNMIYRYNMWNGKVSYSLIWSGATLYSTESSQPATITVGGYKYTRDIVFQADSTMSKYKVCREPI